MNIRIDIECEDGHRSNDVIVASGDPLPPCEWITVKDVCGKPTEQVYANRKESEGYWVINGKNW